MLKKNSGKRKATDWDFFWNEYKKLLITVLPVLLGLAIMILVGYFWIGPLPPLMLSLIFFVGGFTGIIIVVRREIPVVLFTIKGIQAIVEGSVVTLFFWGSALYIILRGLL